MTRFTLSLCTLLLLLLACIDVHAFKSRRDDAGSVKLAGYHARVGKKFMEEIVKQPDVKQLQEEIYYKMLVNGDGQFHPLNQQVVHVHYIIFDVKRKALVSTYHEGDAQEMVIGGLIHCWNAALQNMREGDMWEVYCPAQTAYSRVGSQAMHISPEQTIISHLHLVKIEPRGYLAYGSHDDRAAVVKAQQDMWNDQKDKPRAKPDDKPAKKDDQVKWNFKDEV